MGPRRRMIRHRAYIFLPLIRKANMRPVPLIYIHTCLHLLWDVAASFQTLRYPFSSCRFHSSMARNAAAPPSVCVRPLTMRVVSISLRGAESTTLGDGAQLDHDNVTYLLLEPIRCQSMQMTYCCLHAISCFSR
ncbi:hypothetical protein AMECASPLE_025587 [Ameca splendens]|uniref:Uncharacterized protein n=1 Tax=Ameca splendens TaxID=208324 RepID=A0ABV0YGF0_9TELE